MKVSVISFPGSNCEHDTEHAFGKVLGWDVETVWHKDKELGSPDLVVLPGGFSHGDYLRCGAMASLSPVMESVKDFHSKGGRLLGICNGFQILCEAELLPGVLLQNRSRKFLSVTLPLKTDGVVDGAGEVFDTPVAHFDGNYFASEDQITSIEKNNEVVLRYCSSKGEVDAESEEINPNGSINAIAGIRSSDSRIIGMMPHPERMVEDITSGGRNAPGKLLLEKLLKVLF